MKRRQGQDGYVEVRNGNYRGRFWEDGPNGRYRKAVILGSTSEMTKTEAKMKLRRMLAESGMNEPDYLANVIGNAKTFNQVADKWEAMRLPKLAASSQDSFPKLIEKHLRPFFGKLPVDSIKTGTVNEWIATQKG
jgi:Phage integrase, N-terminal SAM-like domain